MISQATIFTSKSARDKFSGSIRRMEFASQVAGGAVVIGVLIEVWPDILASIETPRFPHLDTVGAIIVAAGVAVEVLMASRIARKAESIQELAAREIAELTHESERLRKEANDTALLLRYRSLGDINDFEDTMRSFAGTPFALEVLPNDNECANFLALINNSLQRAGWTKISRPSPYPQAGPSIAVMTVGPDPKNTQMNPACLALADWLDRHEVAVITSLVHHREGDLAFGTVVIRIGPRPETIEQHRQYRESYQLKRSRPVTSANS